MLDRRRRLLPSAALPAMSPFASQGADSDTSDEDDDEEAGSGDSDMGEEDEETAVARARAVAAAMKSNRGESGTASAGGDGLAAALAELDMEHYDSGDEGGPSVLGGSGNPGACGCCGLLLEGCGACLAAAAAAATDRGSLDRPLHFLGRAGCCTLQQLKLSHSRPAVHCTLPFNPHPPPATQPTPSAGGAYFRDPTADPFLQRNSDSDTDSEAEAFRLHPEDLLILAARNEDDVSHLEVSSSFGAEATPCGAGVGSLLLWRVHPVVVGWESCRHAGGLNEDGVSHRATVAYVAWPLAAVQAGPLLALLDRASRAADLAGHHSQLAKKLSV